MKQIIGVVLSLIVIVGGVNLWLFKAEEVANSSSQLASKQKLEVKEQEKLKEEFKTSKLYQLEQPIRESPFLTSRPEQAKFSYSRSEEKQSKQQAKDSKQQQPAKKQAAKKIRPAKLDLYLQGVVNNNGRTLIIVANEQESHILETGEVINGYQVVKIKGDKVILQKDGQLYRLQSRIKIYN